MGPTRARSRLVTVLALFAALGQLAVTLAPVVDGMAGRSAPAHVESEGVRKHFAHNDAACQVCSAASLRALPSAVRADLPPIERVTPLPADSALRPVGPGEHFAFSPRAPPSWG